MFYNSGMNRFKKFTICRYRAISKPIEINVTNTGVYPIIGMNEGGKTSVLQAMLAFDHRNDYANGDYGQLNNVGNIYKQGKEAVIEADIEIEAKDFESVVAKVANARSNSDKEFKTRIIDFLKDRKSICLNVRRVIEESKADGKLRTAIYEMNISEFKKEYIPREHHDNLSKNVMFFLPPIFYFDDFRDTVKDSITVTKTSKNAQPFYNDEDHLVKTLKKLFEETYKNREPKVSLNNIFEMNDRERKTTAEALQNKVKDMMTDHWSSMMKKLGEADTGLQVVIDFQGKEPKEETINKNKDGTGDVKQRVETIDVVFSVKEMIGDEGKHFSIKDRSKGFIWFFNFFLKTSLNPDRKSDRPNTIYLLDEPGCYLHGTAQKGLCSAFKDLSKNSIVIYNTHSHYLLDEEFISNVKIAKKEKDKNIVVDHFSNFPEERDALEPMRRAFSIEPSILEKHLHKPNLVIVEGIFDFYAWHYLLTEEQKEKIGILASTSANNIEKLLNVTLVNNWRKKVVVILDGDDKGQEIFNKLSDIYLEGNVCFCLLDDEKTVEEMYDESELKKINEHFNNQFSIDSIDAKKSLISMFYKDRKDVDLKKTRKNFQDFWKTNVEPFFENE